MPHRNDLKGYIPSRHTTLIPCKVRGCKLKARWSPWARGQAGSWCERHRQRARRWGGEPTQPAVQTKTLRPLVKEIEALVAKDKTGKIEAVALQLSANIRQYVESRLTDLLNGRPVPMWTARACDELLRSLNSVSPTFAACAAGSLFLLRHREPRYFVSDPGWLGAFVRVWRKLCGGLAVGSYWSRTRNRKEPVYKELPQRVTREIGLLLTTTYAPLAARLIAHEERQKKVPRVIRQYLDDAFTSLQQSGEEPQ